MWRYVTQRLLWLIVIMACVAMVIFTIMWFVPGDPAQIMLGVDLFSMGFVRFACGWLIVLVVVVLLYCLIKNVKWV